MADVSNRRRVQAGVPQGGEFATEARGENPDLIPGGYIVGADRTDFWADHARTAAQDKRTRVPRIDPSAATVPFRNRTYAGGPMQMTMPSRAALDRFAAEQGDEFDIPVHAQYGDLPAISCWVRVHKAANGTWRAHPLGDLSGNSAGVIGESVSSIMEARRPSSGLRDVGDILLRYKAAKAGRQGLIRDMTGASRWISKIGYNPEMGVMTMTTTTGKSYGYEVSQETFNEVLTNASPGAVFNRLIRTRAPRVEVVTCETCGEVYPNGTIHRCGSKHDA